MYNNINIKRYISKTVMYLFHVSCRLVRKITEDITKLLNQILMAISTCIFDTHMPYDLYGSLQSGSIILFILILKAQITTLADDTFCGMFFFLSLGMKINALFFNCIVF